MNLTNTRSKKTLCLIAVMAGALLWLGYQILLWSTPGPYMRLSQEIIESLGIKAMNLQTEWRRGVSVLLYFQTLLHVLLAYCLFIKWPGKKNIWRIALVAVVFCLSLLAVPRIAGAIFPSYRKILSPNNPNYHWVLFIHGLVGVVGALAAFVVDTVKNKPSFQPKAVGRSAARYGLTVVIAFLISVCYGLILGIIKHFSPSAVQHVLSSFSPDGKLITGIITMCIMAPLMEEMAFRGLILTKTRQYAPTWVAVIFSSVVFGLWHRNLGQFIATTIMGIAFSWIYLKTGKLRHAMVAHCLSNLFLALALSKGDGYLPAVGLLSAMKDAFLKVSLPVGILGVAAVVTLVVFLIAKGYAYITEKKN